jgi:signal transduction histidine kinase
MAASPGQAPSALDRRTLVLNRGWALVHVTSVRRALVLMFHRAALAVRPDNYETFDFPAWVERTPDSADRVLVVELNCEWVDVGSWPALETVLHALLHNAWKFTHGTDAHIDISATAQDNVVTLCIRDNGIGFDECYSHKIFKPFERLHGRNAPYSGTGMGLAYNA